MHAGGVFGELFPTQLFFRTNDSTSPQSPRAAGALAVGAAGTESTSQRTASCAAAGRGRDRPASGRPGRAPGKEPMTRVRHFLEDAHRSRLVKARASDETKVKKGGEVEEGGLLLLAVTKSTTAAVMAWSTAPGVEGRVTRVAPGGGGSHPRGSEAAVAALAKRVMDGGQGGDAAPSRPPATACRRDAGSAPAGGRTLSRSQRTVAAAAGRGEKEEGLGWSSSRVARSVRAVCRRRPCPVQGALIIVCGAGLRVEWESIVAVATATARGQRHAKRQVQSEKTHTLFNSHSPRPFEPCLQPRPRPPRPRLVEL